MKIEIRKIDPLDLVREVWNGFDPPSAHPANTTFYAALYRGRLLSTPVFLEASLSGEKVSQWLLAKCRSRRNPLSVELSSHCGPQVIQNQASCYDDIFAAYIDFIESSYHPVNITVLSYALTRGISETALHQSRFHRIEKLWTYVNPLVGGNEILRQFHDSHRNDTRKAIRMGYVYTPSLSLADYLRLSKETYARSDQKGPSEKEVLKIQKQLVEHGKGIISGVSVDGTSVAASIVIYHGERAYYLYGASSNTKSRGATTFIHYENMRLLKDRGVCFYDFGGARLGNNIDPKTQSISAFKSRFGGALVEAFGGSYR